MFGLSSEQFVGLLVLLLGHVWHLAILHHKVHTLYLQVPDQRRQKEALMGLDFRVTSLEREQAKARAS